MKQPQVQVCFLEPFRMMEWFPPSERNLSNLKWIRGQSFARWHKVKGNGGRPYIPGTLLRSAVLRAIEEEAALSRGWWEGFPLCPGEFFSKESKPRHNRRVRSTFSWPSSGRCEVDDPCLLCLFLGPGKFDCKNRGNNPWVRFGNLSPVSHPFYKGPEEIGIKRLLNRVDQDTGKAHDFFVIWEMEEPLEFIGTMEVAYDIPDPKGLGKREALISLIKRAMAFVPRLCGASCQVRLVESLGVVRPSSPVIANVGNEALKKRALMMSREIAGGLSGQSKAGFLLHLADLARAMRGRSPSFVKSLPQGKNHEKGHPIWDRTLGTGRTVRQIFEELQGEIDEKQWRNFCEMLGQALYSEAKQEGLVGPAERFSGSGEAIKAPEVWMRPEKDMEAPRGQMACSCEWILVGQLRAMTPLHVGVEPQRGLHTDQRVLLDKEGRFRLPRSALRGVLRRDLNFATGLSGCKAELGPYRPCICPVCQLMRNITVRDSRSDVTLPPEVRKRIRLNPVSRRPDEGALFDAEVGPEGLLFPFILRYRGTVETQGLPNPLVKVLSWWKGGCLFLGGLQGTGKGRFSLENPRVFRWSLKDQSSRKDYEERLGLRGEELSILWKHPKNSPLPCGLEEQQIAFVEEIQDYAWEPLKWRLYFEGPVLTDDPIAASMEGTSDRVFYRKPVISDDQKGCSWVWALKGDTLRGIVRSALGKQEGLLTVDHEDCHCLLCRTFGNEHESGSIRFEDMKLVKSPSLEMRLDHVAIDRAFGGTAGKLKFDDEPLMGCKTSPLVFEGSIWLRKNLDGDVREALAGALLDLTDGLFPVGAKGSVGYGWISKLEVLNDDHWLKYTMDSLRQYSNEASESSGSHAWPQLPPIVWQVDEIYHPYYILKPDAPQPPRERDLVAHDAYCEDCFTGRLTCKMVTLTPLMVPDTSTEDTLGLSKRERIPPGHKAFRFFRLGQDELAIPGSEIRGVISAVYEAVTNSCFRVIDLKDRVSWRMGAMEAAGNKGTYRPGRVKKDGQGKLVIEEMQMVRLPLYDNKNLNLSNQKESYYSQPTEPEKWMRLAAPQFRSILQNNQRILQGKEAVRFGTKCHGVDLIAMPNTDTGHCNSGYVKFTGPNKVEVSHLGQGASSTQKVCDSWEKVVHNQVEIRPSGPKSRPRMIPFFRAHGSLQSGAEMVYEMTKRCERVFTTTGNSEGHPIDEGAISRYRQLLREYRENANRNEIPPVFRTVFPPGAQDKDFPIAEGDLVYFQAEDWERPGSPVVNIIPVCISRVVDDRPLGKRLKESFRPCAHVCLEDCQRCFAATSPLPLYREGALWDGICPACHLFGTNNYAGRVWFGFAWLTKKEPWVSHDTHLKEFIMPRLEAPRPGWVVTRTVTKKRKKVVAEVGDIPGRKFYVHHQGWRELEKGFDPISGEKLEPDSNNCTVEALAPGNEFTFRIFFENLRDWELGLLLYSLELEPGLAHKMGKGKPQGFGSVKIEIEKINLRLAPGEWEDSTCQKTRLLGKGLSKLEEWARANTLNGEDRPWHQLERIESLRRLLQYCDDKQVQVKYPVLSREKDGEPHGYVELKKKGFNPAKELTQPWNPWWPYNPDERRPCFSKGAPRSLEETKSRPDLRVSQQTLKGSKKG